MATHSLLEYSHVSCVRAPIANVSSFGADSSAAPRQRPVAVAQHWWLRTPIDGQNFSGVQARLAALARSLLAAALQPSVPVIIDLTNFSENLRDHEFGYWLHRQDRKMTTCTLCVCGPQLVPVVLLGRESSKQSLRRSSPSHPASLVDSQASSEHHV